MFIKQVALHKNPRQALSAIRSTLGDRDPASLFDGLSKNAVFLRAIAPAPEPRSFANLWNSRRLSPRGLVADLQWATEALRANCRIISGFLPAEQAFEDAYLVGDWDVCLAILDEIEERNGLSLWLISRRITVMKRTASTPDDDYASTLIASANDGTIVSWLVYMMSFRADPNVAPANYVRTIDSSFENANLPDNLVRFLRYHALSLPPRTTEDAAGIIAISETAPIIDRYLALVDVLQFVTCEFPENTNERDVAAKCVRRLTKFVPDDRLTLLDEVNLLNIAES